jgi:hypothetical protein
MARHLTKKQERYIRIMLDGGLTDIGDMLLTEYNEIVSMNDYETIDSDIQRFISDHVIKEVYHNNA